MLQWTYWIELLSHSTSMSHSFSRSLTPVMHGQNL